MSDVVDVAIVGGGPAGAALAIRLARAGIETTLIERRAAPAWHACGVFSSPLVRPHLGELGFSADEIATLNRPIAALKLETTRGARCRIQYAAGTACGWDRIALETALLARARDAGATVRTGTVARSIGLPARAHEPGRLELSVSSRDNAGAGPPRPLMARLVVGADGSAATVARAAGVNRTRGGVNQSGITFHRADAGARPETEPMEGRFVFGDRWYAGIAPVPGDRVNVGLVVPAIHNERPSEIADRAIGAMAKPAEPWMSAPTTDHLAVAGRLEHHARRVSGPGWLLVGDAIGFIDPLTGEGLLRSFVSARHAAQAISDTLRGDSAALQDYDRRVRRRFSGKNVVSWMLHLFMANPAVLDYALGRLGRRAALRDELTLVLTDQARPSGVINPAFVARMLAP